LFGVLPNPIEALSLAIVIDGGILPAMFGLVHPVREGRLDAGSLTIELSRQGVHGGWDVIVRFREIIHGCDVVAPEFKSLKIRVSLSGFADSVEDTKRCEVWQDSFRCECWRGRCFPRH
jgi:hypothetical protein